MGCFQYHLNNIRVKIKMAFQQTKQVRSYNFAGRAKGQKVLQSMRHSDQGSKGVLLDQESKSSDSTVVSVRSVNLGSRVRAPISAGHFSFFGINVKWPKTAQIAAILSSNRTYNVICI